MGSYELRLSSDGEGFETVTKTFDVWPSADWIDAIANQTKPEVVTEIKTFKLCIVEQVETEPPPTDEPTTGKYTGCAVDQSEFTSDVTALKADADLEDAIDGEQLTFLWFYQRQDGTWEEINKNTVDLQQSLDGFLFTLQGDFSPGEYEVLALLEARNRPPLAPRLHDRKSRITQRDRLGLSSEFRQHSPGKCTGLKPPRSRFWIFSGRDSWFCPLPASPRGRLLRGGLGRVGWLSGCGGFRQRCGQRRDC